MTRRTLGVLTAACIALTGLAGCKDACARYYDDMSDCAKKPKLSRKNFLKVCRKLRKKNTTYRDRTDCGAEETCDAFKSCLRGRGGEEEQTLD